MVFGVRGLYTGRLHGFRVYIRGPGCGMHMATVLARSISLYESSPKSCTSSSAKGQDFSGARAPKVHGLRVRLYKGSGFRVYRVEDMEIQVRGLRFPGGWTARPIAQNSIAGLHETWGRPPLVCQPMCLLHL